MSLWRLCYHRRTNQTKVMQMCASFIAQAMCTEGLKTCTMCVPYTSQLVVVNLYTHYGWTRGHNIVQEGLCVPQCTSKANWIAIWKLGMGTILTRVTVQQLLIRLWPLCYHRLTGGPDKVSKLWNQYVLAFLHTTCEPTTVGVIKGQLDAGSSRSWG